MRIYLSGPITGTDNYRENFQEAVRRLNEDGQYDIINPAELCQVMPAATTSWEEYLKICIELLQMADAIVMLPGWRESRGAQREYGFALASDKIIWEMEG